MKMSFYVQTLSGAFLILMLCVSSCKKDPDPSNCDTTAVSFSADIQPIIEQNCYNGCHSGANPTSGFLLTSYSAVKLKVDDGRLFGAVDHQAGFVAMPQIGSKLSDCNLDLIKTWIDDGAPNN